MPHSSLDSDAGTETEHLRILCFGASITAGWNQYGLHYNPYSKTLEARLVERMPRMRFSIEVDGLPGDTAIKGQYMNRIQNLTQSADTPFDWIIVQGGGNDLGYGRMPDEIFEALQKVWDVALSARSKVLALTTTQTVNSSNLITHRRNTLNNLVLGYQREGFYSLDLSNLLPPASMDSMRNGIYDSDGVHLGNNGYDLMGNTIAFRLIELMKFPFPEGNDLKGRDGEDRDKDKKTENDTQRCKA